MRTQPSRPLPVMMLASPELAQGAAARHLPIESVYAVSADSVKVNHAWDPRYSSGGSCLLATR